MAGAWNAALWSFASRCARIATGPGRESIDVPGYTFRVFVTSCQAAPEKVWRDYNRRADMVLAESQRAAALPGYREPAIIRTQAPTCGAILGRAGRRLVVHLSQSWGGLKTRDPLPDSVLNCQIPTSPKSNPVFVA
jgi:hypothetical protein